MMAVSPVRITSTGHCRVLKYASAVAGLSVLGLAPLITGPGYWRHVLVIALLYSALASNWDITLGYAGVFNWAHVALFALGAYAAGILSKTLGISPWLCMPAAAGVAMLAGALVCLPVLRVKGIYVALVTFAFGEVCRHLVLSQSEFTGGSYGLVLIPSVKIGDYSFLKDGKIAYYYLSLGLFVISTAFLLRLVKSNFGMSIVALRDYEDYAVSRGVPLARQRLLTFVASSAFTGVTGAVYAFYLSVVSPELFGFGYMVTLLSMVLIGGIGTIWGPIIGAFLMTFISESMVSFGAWRFLVIAALTVLVLLLYPEGAIGGIRRIACLVVRPTAERNIGTGGSTAQQ